MLKRADKVLELAGWLVAGALALMLFAGPQLVAEDKATSDQPESAAGSSPYANGGGEGVDAQAQFQERCGSCHTLGAAGTTGVVGPNLDDADLDAQEVEAIMREGRGAMPSFGEELSDAELSALAEYVAGGG